MVELTKLSARELKAVQKKSKLQKLLEKRRKKFLTNRDLPDIINPVQHMDVYLVN